MTPLRVKLVISFFVLIFIHMPRINAASLNDGIPKKLEIFPPIEKTKIIQISQLEEILISIEGTYKTISEKQKEDTIGISQATNELQLIGQRLQNIEHQINRMEQAEIFNKHRFDLFQDNYIKEGLQFDELKRKVEKNQQQTNNRVNEIDISIEKVHDMQETLLKEIRKMNGIQTKLMNSVEEINENLKPDWYKFQQNMSTTQQRFIEDMKNFIQRSTNSLEAKKIIRIHGPSKKISNDTHSTVRYDDEMLPALLASMSSLNEKFQAMQESLKSAQSSMSECVSLTHEIHDEVQLQKQDLVNLMSDTQENINNEIRKLSTEDTDQLGTLLKMNFDILLKEQETFKNNCHLIQLHEERLEDRAVYILEKLFNYIDNKTDGIRTELNRLFKNEIERNAYQTKEIQRISELINAQKDSTGKEVTKIPKRMSTPPIVIKSVQIKTNVSSTISPSTRILNSMYQPLDAEYNLDEKDENY